MPKPSVYRQVEAWPIAKNSLKDSPRHWNNGMFRYRGRLWMSYRFHLMSSSGRCKTAICPIDDATLQPCGPSQTIDLPESVGDEHMEDARLFLHRDEPYVSYTEMTGYQPGVDFKCVMKYARLKLTGSRWKVEETWKPNYGRNDWKSKEKNWIFFSSGDRLYCIYGDEPSHTVLEVEGERIVGEWSTTKPFWEWGTVRGGTPPVVLPDGNMMAVFHSSVPTEQAPAYVRYFAGAYVFRGKAPFDVLSISPIPLMSASEEDGHKVDPRYINGWKPYVVFPCGLVKDGTNYLVSFGINDWQSAIARIPAEKFVMASADGMNRAPRCFRRPNGSIPLGIITASRQPKLLHWMVPSAGAGCSAGEGYIKVVSQREAQEIVDMEGVEEITLDEYDRVTRLKNSSSMVYH